MAAKGTKERPLGVVLVDDHEVVRAGLRSLIDSYDDLSVVGEAGYIITDFAPFSSCTY